MITANEMLKAGLVLGGKDYEVRQCQFVEGPQVIFVNGVVTPLCRTCGPSFLFSDIRLERDEFEAMAADQAKAHILEAIEGQYVAGSTQAPE